MNLPKKSAILRSFNSIVAIVIFTTLQIFCSKPFPESPILDLALLQSFQSQTSASSEPTPNTKKYIFSTQGSYNGNLGGISGADSICQNEKTNNFSSLPGEASTYKAILGAGTLRVACTAANCTTTAGNNTNWPLQPNTEYFRSDDQLIFQTNAAGIFVFGTLTNPFSSVGTDQWWTGLATDWTNDPIDNCSSWATNLGGSNGVVGVGSLTNSDSINRFPPLTSNACNNSQKLLCVRN